MSAEVAVTGASTTPVPGCVICQRITDPDRLTVFEDEHFTTWVTDVYPWAIMLAPHRHDCAGPWELTDDEAGDLGLVIRRITQAMRDSGTTDLVYVLNFGEDIPMPHYHVGFFSRWEPISLRAHDAIYERTQQHPPAPGETLAFVDAVRKALAS